MPPSAFAFAAVSSALAKGVIDLEEQMRRDGLSEEDVKIAQQLKVLYPEVATALNSTEATAVRFSARLKPAQNDNQPEEKAAPPVERGEAA